MLAKALDGVINSFGADRLKLVQFIWARLRANGWDPLRDRTIVWQFIYLLFSGIPHTKTVLEDLLQYVNHLSGRKRSEVSMVFKGCLSFHRGRRGSKIYDILILAG